MALKEQIEQMKKEMATQAATIAEHANILAAKDAELQSTAKIVENLTAVKADLINKVGSLENTVAEMNATIAAQTKELADARKALQNPAFIDVVRGTQFVKGGDSKDSESLQEKLSKETDPLKRSQLARLMLDKATRK